MNLMRLIRLRRYLRCRALFRNPLQSHWVTSCVPRNPAPAVLTFVDGFTLSMEEPRRFGWLWDIVLDPTKASDVSVEAGLLKFAFRGSQVALRLDEPEVLRAFRRMVVDLNGDILPFIRKEDGFVVHWHGEPILLSASSRTSWSTFAEVFIEDCYQLSDLPRDLDTVVDLGCNVGAFALRMSRHAQRVVSVDAIDGVLQVARGNLARNSRSDRVTFIHRAVSDHSGQVLKLWTGEEGSETTTSSVDEDLAGHFGNRIQVEVETISLPDLFAAQGIEKCDLLKIDIETAEFGLFRGIDDQTLAKIDRIAMEVHIWKKPEYAEQYEAIQQRLIAAGFTVRAGAALDDDGNLKTVTYMTAVRI